MLHSVCVVIPTFNSVAFLEEALASVFSQTHKPEEIIVVDDGSTDDTKAFIGPYLDRVRYISQANAGPASARNRAILATRCDWIAFLDADDWWHPEKLTHQMEYAARYPNLSQIGACSTNSPSKERDAFSMFQPADFIGPLPFGISSVVARRDKLIEVEMFNATHMCAAEDRELWIKLSLVGDSLRVNLPLWTYRIHAGQGSRNAKRMERSYHRVLKELFERCPEMRCHSALAYGYYHYDSALAFHDARNRPLALLHLLGSFIRHPKPIPVGNRGQRSRRLVLFVKFLLGDRCFVAILSFAKRVRGYWIELKKYVGYALKIGVSSTIKIYLSDRRSRKKRIDDRHSRRINKLHIKGFPHPFYYRDNSSDFEVIAQIFCLEEFGWLSSSEGFNTIVDCGANIGCSAVYLLEKFKNARIVAVEPDEGNCTLCRMNVRPYGDRAQVIQAGVWNVDSNLIVERGRFLDGGDWAFQVRPCLPGETHDVEGLSMQTIMSRCGLTKIDFLKIDIERGELALFKDNYETWLNATHDIAIELHGQDCEKALFESLRSYSYTLERSGELTICRGLSRNGATGAKSE